MRQGRRREKLQTSNDLGGRVCPFHPPRDAVGFNAEVGFGAIRWACGHALDTTRPHGVGSRSAAVSHAEIREGLCCALVLF